MKKNTTKIIAIFLAVISIFGIMTVAILPANAGYSTKLLVKDDISYREYDNNFVIESCKKTVKGEVSLPSKINKKPVTSIKSDAFKECTAITKIRIPSSIKDIGAGAFSGCTSLTKVYLKEGLTKIAENAFKGCTVLAGVSIPSSVVSIERNAFANCTKLGYVIFNESDDNVVDGITSIGKYTFYKCVSLKKLYLPDTVKVIGESICSGCKSLEKVQLSKKLTEIPAEAFKSTNLYSVVIPNSVINIGSSAFEECKQMTNIVFGEKLASIEKNCFKNCIRLKSVTFPASLTSIGSGAFQNCYSLENANFGSGITSIEQSAFCDCYNIEDIYLPDNLSIVSKSTFKSNSSRNIVVIGQNTTTLNASCFNSTKPAKVLVVPKSVRIINGNILGSENKINELTIIYEGSKEEYEKLCEDNNISWMYDKESGGRATAVYYNYTFKTTKKPTCSSAGERTYYYGNGQSLKVVLSKTAHNVKKIVVNKATLKQDGLVEEKCTKCGTVMVKTVVTQIDKVYLKNTSLSYTGKINKPSVRVKNVKGYSVNTKNYTILYSKTPKDIGTYTATITFSGWYSGTVKLKFKIIPATPTIEKTKTNKDGTVSVKCETLGTVDGWQIKYSKNKNFPDDKTTIIKVNNSIANYKIRNMKDGTKYYIKVRTYKNVGGTIYYSNWSTSTIHNI